MRKGYTKSSGHSMHSSSVVGIRPGLLAACHEPYVRHALKPARNIGDLTPGELKELKAQEVKAWSAEGLPETLIAEKVDAKLTWVRRVLKGLIYRNSPAWKP
jgi:hypothetical protein